MDAPTGRQQDTCLVDCCVKCTACKNLFDEPTTKPAHARLIAESVGVLPGDRVYPMQRLLDAMAAAIRENGNA